jgi:hypothetical protein
LEWNIRKKVVKCNTCSIALYVLKFGNCGKYVTNTCRVLKCGAGEGQRKSVGPIVWKMRKYCMESRGRGISYIE